MKLESPKEVVPTSVGDRYFLDTDQSGHWCLVKAEKRELWNLWKSLDEDNPKAWKIPRYARILGTSPSAIEFSTPYEQIDSND